MIIKEYAILQESFLVIVRSDVRDDRLVQANWLFKVAKEDFPPLMEMSVQIKRYVRENRYTSGIEFEIPLDAHIPSDYTRIHDKNRGWGNEARGI